MKFGFTVSWMDEFKPNPELANTSNRAYHFSQEFPFVANIRIQKNVTLINTAKEEFGLIERLAPLKRTMICDDFDKALGILSQHMPLNIVRVPSGTDCWTWKIPQKWTAISATIHNQDGELVLNADEHPLALAPYSIPFEGRLTRDELINHLRWSDKYPRCFCLRVPVGN